MCLFFGDGFMWACTRFGDLQHRLPRGPEAATCPARSLLTYAVNRFVQNGFRDYSTLRCNRVNGAMASKFLFDESLAIHAGAQGIVRLNEAG